MNARPVPQPADTGTPQEPINKFQLEQALYVAVAGAVGGLLFWVLAKYGGSMSAQIAAWPWYGQVASVMFLGAMAALFGVFLLTASSMNALRTYVFAIVCGVVWQPIITSAISSVANKAAATQAAAVTSQTDQLKAASGTGNSQKIDAAVTTAVPVVTQAIGQLSSVQDATKKQEIVDDSKSALTALEAASDKAPDSSIKGIQTVGIAAGQANQTGIGIQAVQSLHAIGVHAQQPAIAQESEDALRTLGNNTKDPAVKRSAEVLLRDLESQRGSRVVR